MNFILSEQPGPHRTARLKASIRHALREVGLGLSLLNHQAGRHLDLNDVDFEALNLISSHGPLSPSYLARRTRLHPATVTGVLDRLERRGWVVRERDPQDRRVVQVRFIPGRGREIAALFGEMNSSMRQVLDRYTDDELTVICDFLEQTVAASRTAAASLPDVVGKSRT